MNTATRTRRDEYLLLAATSAGVVLAPLNSTMLVVALPELRADLELGHAAIGWLVSGYLVVMAVAQPVGGRLGDQIGRRRLFRWGLIAFLVASVAATFAPNYPSLLGLRLAQAAAGALLIPNARALLRHAIPVRRLGRMNGINSAVTLVAASLGPLLGAALLDLFSWRALFAVNVPVVLLALALERRLTHEDAAGGGGLSMDWTGTALLGAVFLLVTYALNTVRETSIVASAAVALVLAAVMGVFIRQQRRVKVPTVAWDLLTRRPFAAATAHILVTNLVMYTTLLAIPFFVVEMQGHGAGSAGVMLAVMSGLMAVISPLGGWLADVRGRRLPVLAGSLLTLLATVLLLAGIRPDMPSGDLTALLALLGIGVGLGGASMTAAIEAAPRSHAGSAAGTSSMMRYAGSIVGSAVLAGVLAGAEGSPASIRLFQLVFAVVVVFALSAVVSALFVHRYPDDETPGPAGDDGL